jgi:hypothetical protein
MSYDLTLFRPIPGLDPIESYHQIMAQAEFGKTLEKARELMAQNPGLDRAEAYRQAQAQEDVGDISELPQLAERLKSRVPEFRQAPATGGRPWIELDHDAQVQVLITNRDIGITMPYFRKGLDKMMAVVAACIDCLAEAGFVAYDPQVDKIITTADLGSMAAQYRDTDRVLPEIIRDSKKRRSQSVKPWWKFW